jgi:hypothetical protein
MNTDVKSNGVKILICILAVCFFLFIFSIMQRIPYIYEYRDVYYNKEKPTNKTILVFLSGN